MNLGKFRVKMQFLGKTGVKLWIWESSESMQIWQVNGLICNY